MAEKLSIISVGADDELRILLRSNPDRIKLIAETGPEDDWPASVRTLKPDIIVVDIDPSKEPSKILKKAESIKQEFPDLALFFCSSNRSPELIISAMRTGAQEFFTRPFNVSEFGKAAERVWKKREQARAMASQGGCIITVFSKKGGVGVTTLSVNLAVALVTATEKKAALVDLDLQMGDVSSFLDLQPRYNIIDACGSHQTIDSSKLQSCMTHHQSGIFILSEPPHPAESANITNHQISQILMHLKRTYPFVIVDTSHFLDARILAAFELSEYILLPTVPNVVSIRAARKVLDLFREMGYPSEKIKIIVNRVGRGDAIRTENIRKTVDHPVAWSIPNNYPAVINAINTGTPLVRQRRLSNVGKSIAGLAEEIVKWNHSANQPRAT